MVNMALARSIFEADDFGPLLDRLADDVVFEATVPEGTPVSGASGPPAPRSKNARSTRDESTAG